jgi:hypothetical protein
VQPFSLLGALDIEGLRSALLEQWGELWAPADFGGGGTKNDYNFLFPGLRGAARTFPGMMNAKLLFSGQMVGSRRAAAAANASWRGLRFASEIGETCLVFPAWRALSAHVIPLLDELLGHRLKTSRIERHVWRVQLNRLPKGAEIRPHVDQGSYVLGAHRLHIPLIVPKCVRFEQQRPAAGGAWSEIPMKEAEAFEVNNKIRHRVAQTGPYERVSLVIDVAERPCARYVEVSAACTGWDDEECISDHHVDEREWRGLAS